MLKVRCTRIAARILVVVAITGLALAQTAAPASRPLSFEVASIKAVSLFDMMNASGKLRLLGISVDSDRVDLVWMSLMELICVAYKVKPAEVAGNPAWLNAGADADHFNILAKMPEGATKDQVPEMLQALLAERFKLVVRRERRDTAGYALIVGKGGPKLKEAVPDPPAPAPAAEAAAGSSHEASGTGGPAAAKPAGGAWRMTASENQEFRIEGDSMTMENVATMLSGFVGSPVRDMTELKGRYKLSFEVRMQDLSPGMNPGAAATTGLPADSALDPSGSSIFTAVQRLGLKLERRKMPFDFLVIDHVERVPTEN
jgi:uncharacterized protein (TIGR03435 family)